MAGKTGITPESILDSELYGVLIKGRGEASPLSPAAILAEIRAAEDSIEHDIKIHFGRQRIVSEPLPRGLVAGTDYDREEAPYDFENDMFLEHKWGYFELRARPVIAIDRIFFRFPGGSFSTVYTILPEWIRLEKTFGHLRIVPTTSGPELSILAIGAFLMSMLRGGGRGVPHALYVDYQAGFTREVLCRDHNDLLKAVRIRATLFLMGILSNVRGGGVGSQSLSQDGQSRSQSLASGKWGAYSGAIEIAMRNESQILDAWRSSEKGPLFAVA